ncbi:hypothetical protein RHMOL_Rhmol01G0046000 [Rhododendron molle]|uniref:Uncharacterized protein n=1 Tax=Rhododendron molle TaxID=49168 RepID=A0ACC0PZY4_RHOML|nr:hypothetical protein RHMOL_Rhmol01G0046000 [Rhododendron molle]
MHWDSKVTTTQETLEIRVSTQAYRVLVIETTQEGRLLQGAKRSSGDKDTNRAGENKSSEGNIVTKRNKDADVDTDKEINTSPHAILLGNAQSHVKKSNQVTTAQGKEDRQSTVQKSAEILNQVVVEENNNEESSHSTQGLESLVRESIVSADTEDEHTSHTIKAQEWEAQVIECAEVVRQQ